MLLRKQIKDLKLNVNEENIISICVFGSCNREIDFRMYVNKYHRNNEWIESQIKYDMKVLKGIK